MDPSFGSPHVFRFGVFELDVRSGELCKPGSKLRLQDKPLQILALLLEHPGEVVTREEFQKRLWPDGIVVDFEHSIDTAVKCLRIALGDDAEHPRFIETLPRHGYRFIALVEGHLPLVPSSESKGAKGDSPPGSGGGQGVVVTGAILESPLRRLRGVAVTGGLVIAVVAVLFALNVAGLRDRALRAAGAVRKPQIQSIAVLPFENLSHDPEQEYFADGMTEESITNLGKISALRVLSQSSVMQYKGAKKPLPQIARELNVDAIVEGTVARAITDKVKAKVTPEVQAHVAIAHPVNPEAYEAYLKGSTILDNWTLESDRSAIKYFEQALERDSGFSPAFAGSADAYIFMGRLGYLPANEMFPEAKQSARKALALDANSAEAYSALCSVATFYDRDWGTAETACLRAIEINLGYGPARHMYSHYLISMGRFSEPLHESLRYLELDPLSPAAKAHLGMHYKMARQYDLAIGVLRGTIDLDLNFPDAYFELASSYIGKGAYRSLFPQRKRPWRSRGAKDACTWDYWGKRMPWAAGGARPPRYWSR